MGYDYYYKVTVATSDPINIIEINLVSLGYKIKEIGLVTTLTMASRGGVYCGDSNGKLFYLSASEEKSTLPTRHQAQITCIQEIPKKNLLVSFSRDDVLQLTSLNQFNKTEPLSFEIFKQEVGDSKWRTKWRTKQFLVTEDEEHLIISNGLEILKMNISTKNYDFVYAGIDYKCFPAANPKHFMFGSSSHLVVWDLVENKLVKDLRHFGQWNWVFPFRDGLQFICVSSYGRIEIRTDDNRFIDQLRYDQTKIKVAKCTSNLKCLILLILDGSIEIYDLELQARVYKSPSPMKSLIEFNENAFGLAFLSANGQIIIQNELSSFVIKDLEIERKVYPENYNGKNSSYTLMRSKCGKYEVFAFSAEPLLYLNDKIRGELLGPIKVPDNFKFLFINEKLVYGKCKELPAVVNFEDSSYNPLKMPNEIGSDYELSCYIEGESFYALFKNKDSFIFMDIPNTSNTLKVTLKKQTLCIFLHLSFKDEYLILKRKDENIVDIVSTKSDISKAIEIDAKSAKSNSYYICLAAKQKVALVSKRTLEIIGTLTDKDPIDNLYLSPNTNILFSTANRKLIIWDLLKKESIDSIQVAELIDRIVSYNERTGELTYRERSASCTIALNIRGKKSQWKIFFALRALLYPETITASPEWVVGTLQDAIYFPKQLRFSHFILISLPALNFSSIRPFLEGKFELTLDLEGNSPFTYILDCDPKNEQTSNFIKFLIQSAHKVLHPQYLENRGILIDLSHHLYLIQQNCRNTAELPTFCNSFALDANIFMPDTPLPQKGKLRHGRQNILLPVQDLCLRSDALDRIISNSDEYTLKYTFIGLPFQFNITSKETYLLMNLLNASHPNNFYEQPFVKSVTNYMWNKFRFQLWLVLIYHMAMTGIFTAFAVTYQSNHDLASILLVILQVMNLGEFLYEFIQFSVKKKDYFTEFANYIDFLSIMNYALIAILFWTETHDQVQSFFVFSASIIGYTKVLMGLRLIDQMRSLVRLVIEVFRDMSSFMILILIYVVAFSIGMFQIKKEKIEDQPTFGAQIYTIYDFIFGNWDRDNYPEIAVPFFLLLTIGVPLVLLNLLISIIGDTYDRVAENSHIIEVKERLSVLMELFTVGVFFRRKRTGAIADAKALSSEEKRDFLFVVEQIDTSMGSSLNTDWAGRMREMKKEIQKIESKTSQMMEKLSLEVKEGKEAQQKVSKQLEDLRKDLKKEFKDELKQIKDDQMKAFQEIKSLLSTK